MHQLQISLSDDGSIGNPSQHWSMHCNRSRRFRRVHRCNRTRRVLQYGIGYLPAKNEDFPHKRKLKSRLWFVQLGIWFTIQWPGALLFDARIWRNKFGRRQSHLERIRIRPNPQMWYMQWSIFGCKLHQATCLLPQVQVRLSLRLL